MSQQSSKTEFMLQASACYHALGHKSERLAFKNVTQADEASEKKIFSKKLFCFLKANPRAGFTLIEIMVTLAIMISLLALSLTYSRGSNAQISLFTQRARVMQEIVRARSLTAALFKDEGEKICGYGISFPSGANPETGKKDRMILFKDLPPSPDKCPDKEQQEYGGPSELVELIVLDSAVEFGDTPDDILFFPPKPDVYFGGKKAIDPDQNGGSIVEDVEIEIRLVSDINQTVTIKVNLIGQVSSD